MNTTEYIASGILEQYVSGTATAQERQEVECMSHIYPEIKAELLSLQQTFEALALSAAVAPPAHLRDKILGAIKEQAVLEAKGQNRENIVQMPAIPREPGAGADTGTIRRMHSPFMSVAAAILLLISLGLAYLWNQDREQNKQLAGNVAQVQTELNEQKTILAQQKARITVMNNPEFRKVTLAGIPAKSPTSSATVYWNPKSSDVYIAVDDLPQPASDKQYQLWAIADGKPVDMGMLGKASHDSIFQKMKTISNATAFAITLEKEGGVPSPTLSEMYVMGGI